jgi:glycosyltransferase involved in cell wall biosynthesis
LINHTVPATSQSHVAHSSVLAAPTTERASVNQQDRLLRNVQERQSKGLLLSVVLPVFNEVAILERLHAAIKNALLNSKIYYEIIFVNDGSSDGSGEILDRIACTNSEVRVVHFSRNFGHQAAIHAGLSHSNGDAIVVMDSDLQDNPEAIPAFLEKWLQGYDVIYAVRVARKESAWKRFLFSGFYRVLAAVSECPMPNDSGNFGLIDWKVKETIVSMNEHNRFYSGLRAWSGFNQIGINVERGSRYDEVPRVSLFGLVRLARTAIFSFSALPVLIFYVFAGIFLLAFLSLAIYSAHLFINHGAVSSWTANAIALSLFAFINCLGIAILGDYITRIYAEVRQRPPYVIASKVNFRKID